MQREYEHLFLVDFVFWKDGESDGYMLSEHIGQSLYRRFSLWLYLHCIRGRSILEMSHGGLGLTVFLTR